MNINLQALIGDTITGLVLLYMILRLNNIEMKNGIAKSIGVTIIFGVYIYASYNLSSFFIRYMMFVLFGSIIISRIYKINITTSICSVFFSWLMFLVAEILFIIIVLVLPFVSPEIFDRGGLICNIIISLIVILLSLIPKVNSLLINIINKLTNFKNIMAIILLLILALSFSILLYINWYQETIAMNLTLSLIIIFSQIIITVLLFIEKNGKQNMKYKYDSLLTNLDEYEKMLDYQRIANHENKNQLLVIKGMIEKNDKETVNYIDSIIKDKCTDNESFLYQTNKIPSGGLRGLIYYKILHMKEKNIKVEINIDKKVRKINFNKVGIELNKDLCKIIGVILDNAIEAVENLDEKNISISINYENEIFKITIANNFEGKMDIFSIDEKGYTTKGNGHGYGLSLVKDLVNKHKRITNIKEIKSNTFVQNVKLDCTML